MKEKALTLIEWVIPLSIVTVIILGTGWVLAGG
jgi:competence protein ComGC